jgi:hypothetical protein
LETPYKINGLSPFFGSVQIDGPSLSAEPELKFDWKQKTGWRVPISLGQLPDIGKLPKGLDAARVKRRPGEATWHL